MKKLIFSMGILVVGLILSTLPIKAQTNPATQCAEGVRLFREGKMNEALPFLEAGFAGQEEATFTNQNDLGLCTLALAIVRNNAGDATGALEAFLFALKVFQTTDNPLYEVNTLNQLGSYYESHLHFYEALETYQQALAVAHKVNDPTVEADILQNIGLLHLSQQRYSEALNFLHQALAIWREQHDQNWNRLGNTLLGISEAYKQQRRYPEGLAALREALSVGRKGRIPNLEAAALLNIGDIYMNQGRTVEALSVLQQAHEFQAELGSNPLYMGKINLSLGSVYLKLGDYEEAVQRLKDAYSFLQQAGDLTNENTVLLNLGLAYRNQGFYKQALAAYEQALTIARQRGHQTNIGIALNNQGDTYLEQRRYDTAQAAFQEALILFDTTGDQIHKGITLNNIGYSYQLQEQPDRALDYYEQAMTVLESVRLVVGNDVARGQFIAQYASLYLRTADLYQQLGQGETAFLVSERGRARAFLDSLVTGQVQLTDKDSANLISQEQETYAQRQAVQAALLQTNTLDTPDPELVTSLQNQLADLETAYAEIQAKIQAQGGQLHEIVVGQDNQKLLDVPGVQTHLDGQTTLVSYFVLADETLAFIITREDFHAIRLKVGQDKLFTQITAFRDFPTVNDPHPDSVITLYNHLIQPLEKHLNTSHLMIIPHYVLHYLPFAALTDGERYLIDDYTLTTLPSASALPFIQENAQLATYNGKPLALILGNPVTADYDTVASLATTRDSLGSLPFAEKEAKAIADLFGAEPLIGEAATESAVREQVSKANILHLAAHGQFNPVAPLNSLIALAPDEANDGWLTVGETYGLNLENTDLVVLSACQTNLGDLSEGDELVGLTRALIFAGTPSVIASLWNVEDEATSLLMERFYTHLKDGMGKAEALRQAQIEVREEYPNPYYWSDFVLSGDPGEISRISDSSRAVTHEPIASPDGPKEIVTEMENNTISNEPVSEIEQSTSKISWRWLIGGVAVLGAMVILGLLVWWRGG